MKFEKIKAGMTLLFIASFLSFAFNTKKIMKNLKLAGIVVDADKLTPLESAEIYDSNNVLLGRTDQRGYYQVNISCNGTGEISFGLKVVKHGYVAFSQKEHWGALSNNSTGIINFVLKKENSTNNSYSDLEFGSLDYKDVITSMDKMKAGLKFHLLLENAKKNNDDVFFQINGSYYITDKSGWIMLHSDTDMVSINNEQSVRANHLNGKIKRSTIKSMTPINNGSDKFAIYTK